MIQPLRVALSLAFLAGMAGCYVVETEVRDVPPRAQPLPPRRPPPPPPRPPPPVPEEPPPPEPPAATFHVPPDRVPPQGLCRIWYDELPPDRQPAAMTCARAHRVARNHGGRVIWAMPGRAAVGGEVASADYGAVDFHGVPPDQLPPPGYCRVWIDGVPPDRQSPPAPCPEVEREAQRVGGRLLYIPSSDVR
jgi:hypothetical protein